jgi:Zn-dependent peptidase ImmA (M78 family)/transcriptional regulator with XRE-family HTH domain
VVAGEPRQWLGDRIRRARLMARMSLRELSGKVGVSAQAISKYERGLDVPRSEVLIRLGRALGVGVEYLLRPGPRFSLRPAYRKRARLPQREIERLTEEAADLLERWLSAEELVLGVAQELRLPEGFPRVVRSAEEVEIAVEDLRRAWDLGGGPLHDLCGLLAHRGIRVGELDGPEGFDGLALLARNGDGRRYALIVVRGGLPGDRQRFTAAHELSHLVLDLPEEAEKLCHRFAGAFLVPRDALRLDLGEQRRTLTVRELMLLKLRYRVSMQALIRRAAEAGVLPEDRARGLLTWFRRCGYHRREPGPQLAPERPGARLEEMVQRGLSEGLISEGRARELLGQQPGSSRGKIEHHRAAAIEAVR